jgi:TPP-dependent pyruvate/acetoin dehydrogenase alpha subunit
LSTEELYRQMITIRTVEERLLKLFSEGHLNGTVHTCLGQEACAVGVVNALDRVRDILFSNHRCHGHFLAYSDNVDGLIAELMGRSTGVCGGVGGSQHLHERNFYSNGIQGGIVPVAAGMAFAEKMKSSSAIAAVFLGDGTFGEGVVYETFNMAALWSLPILFVAELNGYAQSTPTALEHAGDIETRAESFGIRSLAIDADDVLCVHQAGSHLISQVRESNRPALLCLRTYRLGPHSKGDDTRPAQEIERNRLRDPLLRLERELSANTSERIRTSAETRVREAVNRALVAPVAGAASDASANPARKTVHPAIEAPAAGTTEAVAA